MHVSEWKEAGLKSVTWNINNCWPCSRRVLRSVELGANVGMLVTTRTDTFLDGNALSSSKISLPWGAQSYRSSEEYFHMHHCITTRVSLYRCVAGGVDTDVFSGQTPVERRHLDPIRGQRQKMLPGFIQIHSSAHVCPVIHGQRKTLHQNNTERNHRSTVCFRSQ